MVDPCGGADGRGSRDLTGCAWSARDAASTPSPVECCEGRDRRIIERVVESIDQHRLHSLVAIGVEELIPPREGAPGYLVDHQTGRIVWCASGRNAQTLQEYSDVLDDNNHPVNAVSIDIKAVSLDISRT